MGDGMARNLIKGGRDVVVWNRTGGKAVDFSRETGCQTAGTPREVRARTYVCISIVSSPYKNKKIISNSSTSPGVPEKKEKMRFTPSHQGQDEKQTRIIVAFLDEPKKWHSQLCFRTMFTCGFSIPLLSEIKKKVS